MPLPRRNLTIGFTMKVNIPREHLRPKGSACHSYSFPFHLNHRNFLTLVSMGIWRKASLISNPAHMVPCWNHFLTTISKGTLLQQKYICKGIWYDILNMSFMFWTKNIIWYIKNMLWHVEYHFHDMGIWYNITNKINILLQMHYIHCKSELVKL